MVAEVVEVVLAADPQKHSLLGVSGSVCVSEWVSGCHL